MTVKKNISMAEFGAIVNTVVTKCFEDGVYDPTYQEFWTKYAIISVFCDYPFGEKTIEEIWNDVNYNSDMTKAWSEITQNHRSIVDDIYYAVSSIIQHKNEIGAYSMTDMALTNLIDAVSAKIDSMEEIFTEDNMQALVDMSGKLSKLNNVSQKKIISTIISTLQDRKE